MRNKAENIYKENKKSNILKITIVVFCFLVLSGCKSGEKALYEDFVSEDSLPEIFEEKELSICILGEWQELYGRVLVQYESILKEVDDLDVNSAMEKFYEGGEWEYVDIELYMVGRREGIWYSLCDLTNDGLPELILGAWDMGIWENGQWENGFYNPYAMYYYNREKDTIDYYSYGGFPTTFYEGGVTLSIGAGMNELMMFSQFQEDTMQWEREEEVGKRWENGEFIGYYRDDCDREMISAEEYYRIINQYVTTPIELNWYLLDFGQTDNGRARGSKRVEIDLPLEGDTPESMNHDTEEEVYHGWGD
ncbi:MAG: hypothetical protein NC121_02800 [Blautia sp.]|nr:hypothetical protein [Blautia sp.]